MPAIHRHKKNLRKDLRKQLRKQAEQTQKYIKVFEQLTLLDGHKIRQRVNKEMGKITIESYCQDVAQLIKRIEMAYEYAKQLTDTIKV